MLGCKGVKVPQCHVANSYDVIDDQNASAVYKQVLCNMLQVLRCQDANVLESSDAKVLQRQGARNTLPR